MSLFDGLGRAAQHHQFIVPVELADLAGREEERDEGLLGLDGGVLGGLPGFDVALNAVVSADISLGLEAFEQTACSSALCVGQRAIVLKPGV